MTEIKIDPEKKYTGKVAKWLNHKGIGFIAGTYFFAKILFQTQKSVQIRYNFDVFRIDLIKIGVES